MTQIPIAKAVVESPGIPLFVGVVGHRDLVPDEVPAIRDAADQLLRVLQNAQPDVPVKLLSAQAEGADLVVADAARELGIGIIAVLPFTEAQCRADLTSDAARATFDRTMAGAERLELTRAAGTGSGEPVESGEARDRQFQRAGALIAQHCSLLIAIWDGRSTAHRAGTARTIELRRGRDDASGEEPLEEAAGLSLSADDDLIYEIRCSRLHYAAPETVVSGVRVVGFSTGERSLGGIERGIPAVLATQLARTAQFNSDVRDYGRQIALQGRPFMTDPAFPASGALLHLNQLFTAADWLAGHFGRCFRRALALRFSLWALMAYLLLAFKSSPDGVRGLAAIAAVLLIFALGWLLAYWARRCNWDRLYLDYRALAEGLRVDFYWELSGVRAQFDDAFAHENFLQKQDAQIEWMRAAMRAVNLRCALFPRAAIPNGFEQALLAWVGDPEQAGGTGQLLYYRTRTVMLEHRVAFAENISRIMLVGGLLLAVILVSDVVLRLLGHAPLLALAPRGVMLMALALLTAYTAIFEVYLAERADRSLVRQYRHMETLFGFAAQQLRTARDRTDKLNILRALGHACLTEHAQWILAHRDKRIDGLRW